MKDGLARYCKICIKIQQDKYLYEDGYIVRSRKLAKKRYRKDIKKSRLKNNEYKRKIARSKLVPLEKACMTCRVIKKIDEFYTDRSRPDGTYVTCKDCERARARSDYHKHHARNVKKNREWRQKNKKKLSEKIRNNIDKNIIRRMRCRVWASLKRANKKKTLHTLEYVGCNGEFLKNYLASRYYDKYSELIDWNIFCANDLYNIDHIIPCEAFDLSKEGSVFLCFHYSNLQIISKKDNELKSDYLPNGERARYLERRIENKEDFEVIRNGGILRKPTQDHGLSVISNNGIQIQDELCL